MDGLRFPVAIHLNGTLAADAQGAFALPIGMTFESVCACASNDSDAKLQLGLEDDADGLMSAKVIGDSSAPKTFVKTDFDGAAADAAAAQAFVRAVGRPRSRSAAATGGRLVGAHRRGLRPPLVVSAMPLHHGPFSDAAAAHEMGFVN